MPRFLTLFILLFSFQLSFADSSVWSVTNGKNTVFLAGTIHVLKPEHYPLPKEFEQAYKEVKWLVFETNINEVEAPEFIQQFSRAMLLPEGDSLAKHISAKSYQALKAYAKTKQLPIENLDQLRPQMISLIISLSEIEALGYDAEGVDSFFNKKAELDNKIVSHLESVEQQLAFIVNMAKDDEDGLISQTLKDLPKVKDMMEGIQQAWQTGDRQKLFDFGLKDMLIDSPSMYRDIVKKRNDNWMPAIENLIKHPEKKLIMVGSLHLIGEDGLLQRLEKKGYKVEQL